MLWLAYAHGSSHRDIASTIGVKVASVKLLLFRARRKLALVIRNDSGSTKAGPHAD
jgi:RNA polymerase sigma-70 factor (ECF subfamily)